MDDPLDAEQVEETLKRIERILESFSGLIFHTGSTSNEKLAGALWLLDEEPLRFKGVGKDRRMVSRNREKGRVMREEGTWNRGGMRDEERLPAEAGEVCREGSIRCLKATANAEAQI